MLGANNIEHSGTFHVIQPASVAQMPETAVRARQANPTTAQSERTDAMPVCKDGVCALTWKPSAARVKA